MAQTKLIKNSFVSPVIDFPGRDLSDDLIEVFELIDHVDKGPSGDPTDFVVIKKPILVDKYHLNKVLEERCVGNDLKSIAARCEKTLDYTPLTSREVVYGDEFKTPTTLGDAFELAEKGASLLDGMDEQTRSELIELSKGSKSDFDAYINKKYEELYPSTYEEKEGDK